MVEGCGFYDHFYCSDVVKNMRTAGRRKISYGHVIQTFNDDGKCIEQEFVAGDQVEWEDENDGFIPTPVHDYQPFHMVQPQGMTVALVGNISDGFGAVGPFADFDEACRWADGQESWIMTMQSPYEEFDDCTQLKKAVAIPVIGTMGEDGQVKFKEPRDV